MLQREIDDTKYACNHNFKHHSWHCAYLGCSCCRDNWSILTSSVNFVFMHCRYVYADPKIVFYSVYWSQYGFYGWVEVILPTSVQFHLDFWVASKLLKYPIRLNSNNYLRALLTWFTVNLPPACVIVMWNKLNLWGDQLTHSVFWFFISIWLNVLNQRPLILSMLK